MFAAKGHWAPSFAYSATFSLIRESLVKARVENQVKRRDWQDVLKIVQ